MADVIDLDSFRTRGNVESPRSVADTLREVARGIDAGELNPEMVYVAMHEPVPGSTDVDYMWSMSTMDKMQRVGLLARHLYLMNSL